VQHQANHPDIKLRQDVGTYTSFQNSSIKKTQWNSVGHLATLLATLELLLLLLLSDLKG
jgi:hypothetical protein